MSKTATRKGVVEGQAKAKPARRKKPKSTRGRPTKFLPEYIEQGRKIAMLGHTNEEMARFFEVGQTTFDRWLARYAEFRGAIKKGKDAADANMVESLYRRGMGYSHAAVKIMAVDKCVEQVPYIEHYPPDTTACIFWLKNRQPKKWRDKVEQEVSGPEGGPIEVKATVAQEVAARLAAIRAKHAPAQSPNAG